MTDPTVIARALHSPKGAFIEDGCAPATRPRGLLLRLRTDTAFHLPVAAIFTTALTNRLALPRTTAESIELALHEALANAIMHGNLGLASQARGDTATYGDFCQMLQASLQDHTAASRTIQVAAYWTKTALSIGVTDQGSGFSSEPPALSDQIAHGRGLNLIRALAVSVRWNQHRRRLGIIFNIAREDTE